MATQTIEAIDHPLLLGGERVESVRENRDDLKWCGSAPFYTFLKSIPQQRGRLLNYEQWNIDERSVVSFAGMAFTRS